MNKLNSTFKPSNTFRGSRHIVKGQIIQGDDFEVDGIRRAFWSNPEDTFLPFVPPKGWLGY